MKLTCSTLCLAIALASLLLNQRNIDAAVLAEWTFETTAPTTAGSHAAENGIFASSSFASVTTSGTIDSPSGNASTHSFNSNNWNSGEAFNLSTATTGYEFIRLTWDQTSNSDGPLVFDLTRTLPAGSPVTLLNDYAVLTNANAGSPSRNVWSTGGTQQAVYTRSIDLTDVDPTSANQGAISYQLVAQSTPAAAGTSRIDNFRIEGSPLPNSDDMYWSNAAGGSFFSGSNWTGGVAGSVPGSANTVIFALPNTYTVSFEHNRDNAILVMQQGDVTFNLQGHEHSSWPNGGAFVGELAGNNATLRLSGAGTARYRAMILGNDAGAQGTVAVSGAGTKLISDIMIVGSSGTGTTTVSGGAELAMQNVTQNRIFLGLGNGSTGTLTVDGAGSKITGSPIVTVGGVFDDESTGQGSFNVLNGATVDASFLFVADSEDSTGEVLVSGTGSLLNTVGNPVVSSAVVGSRGNGSLRIEAGGQMTSTFLFQVGDDPGSNGDVVVTGTGSGLTAEGISIGTGIDSIGSTTIENNATVQGTFFDVGAGGTGIVTIRSGGKLTTSEDIFSGIGAYESVAYGEVTVTGSGSRWDSAGQIEVGETGIGKLTVANGGVLSITMPGVGFTEASGLLQVGQFAESQGEVTVDGTNSQLAVAAAINIGREGEGSLLISNGALVSSHPNTHVNSFNTAMSGSIGRNATGEGEVTITGSNSKWTQSGMMAVGYFGKGTLNIESGGQLETLHGQIARATGSTGTVAVSGTNSKWNVSGKLSVGGSDVASGGTGSLTVSNQGNVTVGDTLKLWSGGTTSLQGGTLDTQTFNAGPGTFNFTGGTLKVRNWNADSAGGNLVQNGAGSLLDVTGNNTTLHSSYNLGTGTVTVGNGRTLTIDNGMINSAGAGIVNVNAGGAMTTNNLRTDTANLDGAVTIRTDGGSAGASKVETLSMSATGKLNLKNNDLVVGTGSVGTVRGLIKTGLLGTSGITSDVATPAIHGFGYAAGNNPNLSPLLGTSLSGQTFDSDSVLVKFTYRGDADLDGDSDLDDLGFWANSFTGDLGNPVNPVTFWTQGDWDYDGDTDLDDLGFWSSTFTGDLGGGGLSVYAPDAPEGAVAALAAMGITAVPEPSTTSLTIIAAFATLQSLRRRKR